MSEKNIVITKICKISIFPHSFTLNDFLYVVQYSYKMLYNIRIKCCTIPSLTLFRLKIAAIADSYCVCGFYDFFVKCVMIISLLNV